MNPQPSRQSGCLLRPAPGRTGGHLPHSTRKWSPLPAADIAALLPAARAARDGLRRGGRHLTRDALASRMRASGHFVRNARLTPLLQALRGDAASPAAAAN